ncbi:MAG: hypothetical protein ACOC2T_01355 [Planctomycetota bacterium]
MSMSWLRKNRKIIIAVLVVVLMIAWGALPAIRYLVGDGQRTQGEIRGEPIGPIQMRNASEELSRLGQYGVLDSSGGIGRFIFGGQDARGADQDAVWRYLVLVHEADAAGFEVAEEELDDVFAPEGPVPAGDPVLRRGVENLMKISRLVSFRMDSAYRSTAEEWMKFNFEQFAVKMRLVEVDPEIFLDRVEVNEEEVREFYEDRKDVRRKESEGTIGYEAPERVRVEYAFARPDDFEEKVEVSEEDIEEHYEENKSDYAVESEGEKEGEDNDNGGEGSSESEDGSDDDSEEPEAEYQPLAEVRDEIETTLQENKAQSHVEELMERVMEDLDQVADNYVNEPYPLGQMARRHDVEHVIPETEGGRDYLSAAEIRERLPGGEQVAERIFEEELEAHYYTFIDTGDGPMVLQVLDRQEPRPEPFDEVEERVEQDLRMHTAMERARELAGEVKDRLAENGWEEVINDVNAELVDELGSPENTGENEDAEDAEHEGDGSGYLNVIETDFVSRDNPRIEELGEDRRNLVAEVMELEAEDVAMVEEPPPNRSWYVCERADVRAPAEAEFAQWRMQRQFQTMFRPQQELQEWLEGLVEKSPPPSESEK